MLFYLQFVLLLLVGGVHLSSGGSIFEQVILSQNFYTCKIVDLENSRFICEIHSEEDENNLVCLGLTNCKIPVTLCPDGSINKTCFPLREDNSLSYLCICQSKRRAESIVPITEWTKWTTSTILITHSKLRGA